MRGLRKCLNPIQNKKLLLNKDDFDRYFLLTFETSSAAFSIMAYSSLLNNMPNDSLWKKNLVPRITPLCLFRMSSNCWIKNYLRKSTFNSIHLFSIFNLLSGFKLKPFYYLFIYCIFRNLLFSLKEAIPQKGISYLLRRNDIQTCLLTLLRKRDQKNDFKINLQIESIVSLPNEKKSCHDQFI